MAGPPPDERRGLNAWARAALVGAALVIIIVAFVLAQGGDEAETPTRAATQTVTTTVTEPAPAETQTQGEGEGEGETETEAETEADPAEPPVPEPDVVRVVGGRPQGGPKTLEHTKGDEVVLRVRSDTADEVHVHGYDLTEDVPAGGSATFRFDADIEGRFEIELHGTGALIATLDVAPA